MTTSTGAACALCTGNEASTEELPPRERVHVGAGWRVIAHRSALPGWMLVAPRRHVESMAELTGSEAAELGEILRAGSQVLADVVGCERTYVMQFSEGMRHLHFSLVPRMADLPAERLGAKIGAYNAQDEPLDETARDEIAGRLAASWPA
ncbi:MAG: hypothetical protein JJE50_03240 [Actinomycetales bacterium]|nr:hypothetical protein [Actinomycetales bacterium]